MRLSRTWIDTHLSAAERERLVEWLLERSQNPTGDLIQRGLAELYPQFGDSELPSVASCLNWRNAVWAWELSQRSIRRRAELAKTLTAASATQIASANRDLAEAVLFDQLSLLEQGGEVDREALLDWMGGVAKLARSARADAELRAKLEKLEAEKAALAKELNDAEMLGGITTETLERIREKVGLL